MRHRDTIRSFHPFAAAILVAMLWLALGCGSDERPTASEEESPAATPAPTPAADPSPTPDTAESDLERAVITDDVVPEGYPSDVPIYPNATAGPAMAVPGMGLFATFLSDDEVADVLDHYRSELSGSGWSLEEFPGFGFDATKEGRSVEVRARRNDEGKTEIAVNINED